MGKWKIVLGVLIIVVLSSLSCHALNFSQDHVVVWFDPYVSKRDGDGRFNAYGGPGLIELLKKVASKFGRIMMRDVEIQNYKTGISTEYIPTAVANFNKFHRKAEQVPLELLMVFDDSGYESKLSSFDIAKELADRANSIFAGTVKTIVFQYEKLNSNNKGVFESQLMALHSNLANATFPYKLGAQLHEFDCGRESSTLKSYLPPVLKYFDIVIFSVQLPENHLQEGAYSTTRKFFEFFKNCVWKVKEARTSVEIGFKAYWPDTDTYNVQNFTEFVVFWEEMNNWAVKHNATVVLQEAFDNPFKKSIPPTRTSGWWRLVENPHYYGVADYVFEEKESLQVKISMQNLPTPTSTPLELSTPTPPPSTQEPPTSHPSTQEATIPSTEELTNTPPPSEVPTSPSPVTFINDTHQLIIIAGVTGSILFGFIILSMFVMYKRITSTVTQQHCLTRDEIKQFFKGGGSSISKTPTIEGISSAAYNKKLEISKGSFVIDETKVLGSGEFGAVYRGSINAKSTTYDVAVKTTKSCSATGLKGIFSEIKVLSHIGTHQNIVSIVGAYTAELQKGKIYVFIELCTLGSLESYLRTNMSRYEIIPATNSGRHSKRTIGVSTSSSNNRYNNIPNQLNQLQVQDLHRWSYEIACGMEFVVHADLATRNVLLTNNKVAKISDFGLSRRLYNYTNYVKSQQEPLPWRWMSPESLARLEFNEKSDVWSFGVTLWEIFSFGDMPYPGLSWSMNFVSSLENGLRPGKPKCGCEELYSVLTQCWELDPQSRPPFYALKTMLK